MSGERLKKSWRNKKNQVTITMWVSLQIILDRKDAYPEELISLAVHSFWQSAKLSFFSSSLWSNSEPAKKNNNKKQTNNKTHTGAAQTDNELTLAEPVICQEKSTCWMYSPQTPANMTELNDGKTKQLKCLHNWEKAHKPRWRPAKQMSLTSKPI